MGRDYKTLSVWEKGIAIVEKTYKITIQFPDDEKYGLIAQMRRCAVSIPSNVAEVCGRNYDNELRRFLSISMGSCSELETQLIISEKLKYVSHEKLQSLFDEIDHFRRMCINFMKTLERQT